MAKNKTRIDVITVFDGELDATDVFVSLIAQKHSQKFSGESGKNNLAKTQELCYTKDKVAARGADGGLHRGNLEALPQVGRYPHRHHPECQRPALLPRGGEHL